jgi:hypothetical protein
MAGAALGHHQHPDRRHRPVAALRRPRRPARLGGPRRADRIQRVELAPPVPVLAVSAIHLDHPHAGRRQVAGQARPVAAGPFDTDQGDVPESAQPVQQAGVSGRGDGELLHAQQPADPIQRGRDMQAGVGVHAAGDDTCVFYDGHSRPFRG